MNVIIHAKNCEITESMRDYAIKNFEFLSEYRNASTQLTIELMKKDSIQIKSIVKTESSSAVITVTSSDYYHAISSVSKKTKAKLNKSSKIKKRHECDSLAESFIKIQEDDIEELVVDKQQLPLYQLDLEDAISQLKNSPDNVLFFTTDGASVQVLTEDVNGSIKLFSTN